MSYSINNNILNIKSDYKSEFDEEIKKIIVSNKISHINFYSDKYEILNELNFTGSNIKSIIICSLGNDFTYLNQYLNNNNDNKTINLNNLPISLESFEIANSHKNLKLNPKIFQNLPPNLKKLKLYTRKGITLENLPNTLEILDITHFSNQINILDYLPTSLKFLNFRLINLETTHNDFTELNFNSLPSGLESLKITGQYSGELNCLPVNLKILHLPSIYYSEIKNIPKNLEELKIPLEYEFLNYF